MLPRDQCRWHHGRRYMHEAVHTGIVRLLGAHSTQSLKVAGKHTHVTTPNTLFSETPQKSGKRLSGLILCRQLLHQLLEGATSSDGDEQTSHQSPSLATLNFLSAEFRSAVQRIIHDRLLIARLLMWLLLKIYS